MFLTSVWNIWEARRGLAEIHARVDGLPLTFIGPGGGMDGSRPLVLIGHGFAGSGTVMRGFALTLAHAGYVTALWDFAGHGANSYPLESGLPASGLTADAGIALEEAGRLGLADLERIAILGHSMGSGVALDFGQQHPETAATIAVSPVGTPVTPQLPRNLLLLAGELEPRFAGNAEQRLAEAGGTGGDLAQGTARRLVIVPGVEHITILFSPTAHAAALAWLDETFGPQPGARPYVDQRVVWFGTGILATLVAVIALSPRIEPDSSYDGNRPLWQRLIALVAGALGSTVILWGCNQVGFALEVFLGLRVGGYLLVWFGLAGAISLALMRARLRRPTWLAVLVGLLIFAALWLGVGLLGHTVWLSWLLIPRRLVLWPLASLLLLWWFLAVSEASLKSNPWGRVGWWLFGSALVIGALILALRLTPALGFLILILPVTPLLFLLHAAGIVLQQNRWTMALSGALFVSWLLLAVFPLA